MIPDALPSPESLRTAADRLVSALAAHADPEYRLAVLKRLVRRLGEEQYPFTAHRRRGGERTTPRAAAAAETFASRAEHDCRAAR